MGIKFKYITNEDEVQQVYKLSSMKENIYMLGGGIIPPILRENAAKKEIIIAKDEEKVVGFNQFHKKKDHTTVIYHIAVHPQYRGMRIATKMIKLMPPPYSIEMSSAEYAHSETL